MTDLAQHPTLLIALVLTAGIAVIAGIGVYVWPRLVAAESRLSALRRVLAWSVAGGALAAALISGWRTTIVAFALISFISLREFLTLAPTRREDRLVVLFVYGSVLISYWSIWIDNYHYFLVIVPIYIFVATAFLMALVGRPDGFLATAGIMQWGAIICVYNLGHAAFLIRTPEAETPQAGAAGLVFFLVIAAQFSDLAQAVFDRLIGRRLVSARISDTTTWEGLAAGSLATCLAFVAAAPWFSPLAFWPAVFVGAGFPFWAAAGRLTVSAVKRDLGVASSSRLIPGGGGALDRVASLTFAAPWYFHMHAIFALEKF